MTKREVIAEHFPISHCEEQSDEAISSTVARKENDDDSFVKSNG